MPVKGLKKIPKWVWIVTIALASAEPLLHVWMTHYPPKGTAPTGMHGLDSVVYLHCMRMFDTDFHSPFASCQSPNGLNSPRFFPVPFDWMYGIVGAVGRALHLDEFLTLGLANGVGGFLYLMAVYAFLRQTVPKRAELIFLLFTLAGGLGGVLFIITGLLGYHGHPNFEPYFTRYALYELIEGTRPLPIRAMSRLYYTASLASLYGALTLFIRALPACIPSPDEESQAPANANASAPLLAAACVLMFLGTIINLRFGPMAWGIAVLYLYCLSQVSRLTRVKWGAVLALPILVALIPYWFIMNMNPVFAKYALLIVRDAMWISPFLSAIFFHLFLAPSEIKQAIQRLRGLGRVCAYGLVGYLSAFAILYILWHVYYGNFWRMADFSATKRVSDPALAGALAGMALALLRKPRQQTKATAPDTTSWAAIWALLFLVMAMSGFGKGWYFRLVPSRIAMFVTLPICILSAQRVHHLYSRRPRLAKAAVAVMLSFGLCSILVGELCFQGPLGFKPTETPFAWLHNEAITQADDACLEHLGPGRVLTPLTLPCFGDFVSLRGNSAIYGNGKMNLSDTPIEMDTQGHAFWEPGAQPNARRDFVETWCVDWVYCPNKPPVDPKVINEFRNLPWMAETAKVDDAVLFQVIISQEP